MAQTTRSNPQVITTQSNFVVVRDSRHFIPFYSARPGKAPFLVVKNFTSDGEELLTFQILNSIHAIFQRDAALRQRSLKITLPPSGWWGTLEDWVYTQANMAPQSCYTA